jgi:elongation factor G
MPPRTRIRNIGIMAHVDAGKTTCTERVLFYTGRIHRRGEVHDGTATTDFLPEEIKRGITISAAAVTTSWDVRGERYTLRIIDTPGHVDFAIEVERSLRVLDGAVFVLDASAGVECQSESVWHKAERHGVPRLTFINKMDKVGANFDDCITSMRERLGARPVALQLPLGEEGAFQGVVDLVRLRALVWENDSLALRDIPGEALERARTMREALVEAAAEHSDELLGAWSRGDALDELMLVAAIRRGTLAGAIHPVVCGSAYKNRGIEPLLDAIALYLPSPEEAQDERPNDPLAALVFKTVSDARGSLALARIYSGTLKKGDAVLVDGEQRRVGRLFVVHARDREEITQAQAGDIVAVMGLGGARTGSTVCSPERPVTLESIEVPDPVLEVTLEPRTNADRDRLGETLARIVSDDPSLRVRVDDETGQTVLCAMGQLHVEIVESHLSEAGVSVRLSPPKVAYRDTLAHAGAATRVDYKHVKQGGGAGQYARVVLEIEPAPRGSGLAFADATRGGVVPAAFVPGVEKGVRAAATRGLRHGIPLVDLSVRLVDGDTHVKDSSALAFEIAAFAALREGATKAGLRLLEPIMALEVSVPEASVGDVIGDLASRRGSIRRITPRPATSLVEASVPLANLFGYVGDLRNLTHGRGSVAMKPEAYDVVPEREVPRALG